ncbi:unnamed protein product, partial [Ectocarpus sp. 12 AP-2014]
LLEKHSLTYLYNRLNRPEITDVTGSSKAGFGVCLRSGVNVSKRPNRQLGAFDSTAKQNSSGFTSNLLTKRSNPSSCCREALTGAGVEARHRHTLCNGVRIYFPPHESDNPNS